MSEQTVVKTLREQIAASVQYRNSLLTEWKENVSHRVMKPFTAGSVSTDTVAVPEDWARTKQKTAQLSYQVPRIILTPKHPQYATAAPIFQAVLNHKLHHEVKADVMLDECLADVVNAAGIMVSMVGIDITTETVDVPEQDISQLPPDQQMLLLQSGRVKTVPTERPIYQCYKWKRISPGAFLWPAEFSGSDWDDAPWLGYESWMLLTEARKKFKLPEDFKSTDTKPALLSEDILEGPAKPKDSEGYVKLQTIIYKAALYHDDAYHPEHFRRIVYVDGREEPVVNEDLPWQEYVAPVVTDPVIDPKTGEVTEPSQEIPGHYIGVRKNPIRVATLTYVSDLAIPPSDTRAGRSQVRELIRSRSQMLRQRDRSIPVRGYDTNRIDETIIKKMEDGEWLDWIPVNGPGQQAIWEVARANYPRENFTFQNIIGQDLDRAWSLSNNQLATQSGEDRSATEAKIIQSASTIRLEYEKARVARYVIGGVEVLAGLVQLFTDHQEYVQITGPDGAKRMEAWDKDTTAGEFVFDIVPDSADRIDPAVRQERILKLYNLAANDPTINRSALTRQLVESFGMDPALVLREPPEQKEEKPNVSYRFGGDDMINPMAVALMLKANPDLGPQQIDAAVMMIKDSILKMQGVPVPPPAGPGGPGAPPMPQEQPPVEPPDTVSPILKRAVDGSRMM